MPRLPRGLRKPFLGATCALLLLAILEAGARLSGAVAPARAGGDFYSAFRDLLVDLGGFRGADRVLEPDPELFWKLRPGVRDVPWHPPLFRDNRSNALGYRDPERGYAAAPGALRLLCLGDSCTYGMGVRAADSYPQRLEALLANAYTDRLVEVWNGGVPGWSSDQGRVLLKRDGERVAPAFVTVAFGVNDRYHWDLGHHERRGHGRCITDREARARLATATARLDRALGRLALYRLLGRLLRRDRAEEPAAAGEGSMRVPEEEYRDNLRAIAAEARRLGAQPVFVVWPIRWQIEKPPDGELEAPTSHQLATRAAGREFGVPVVDLLERLTGQDGLYVDSVHMNEEGCRRVALEIGSLLYELQLLPEPPRPAPR